uniref:Uncharacterized protein n=1 Tax=Rhizophora mucronata TaxID=61149 RepID=A0A2P2PIZ9_RHIMU
MYVETNFLGVYMHVESDCIQRTHTPHCLLMLHAHISAF